jgi:alpha-N-arabinofuranosidase
MNKFLKPAKCLLAAAAASLLLCSGISSANNEQSFAATVTVHANVPGPQIHRNVFGQFAEFVGNVFSDGIYVGEDSPVPNTKGFRKDVIDALRELKVPLVRWPGGCYADYYHWRDGIGPKDKRPRRLNALWGGTVEDNAVGTHEFFEFLELIGADAYVNGNLGTGTPQEMMDWVEYMTGDRDTTIVAERRANGRNEPWDVAMFAIGNETWACGGNITPEYSALLHRKYATFLHTPPYPTFLDKPQEDKMEIIASGGNVDDFEFTRVMMESAAKQMDALTLHYYTVPRRIILDFGSSTGFPESEWASTLKHALWIDELITKHSEIMDTYDPEKRIGLYVDEWGMWYDPEPDARGLLWQQNTIRDALVAALHFNVFIDHAERVRMTSISQVANVLQAPILTSGADMLLTPTYHVYRMYVPFQDAIALNAEIAAPEYVAGDVELDAINAAAAKTTDGRIVVSLINLHSTQDANVRLSIAGVDGVTNVQALLLHGVTTDAHNTFDKPESVVPMPLEVTTQSRDVVVALPARSVAVVQLSATPQ